MGTEITFADYLRPELSMLIPALYTAMQLLRRFHMPEKPLAAVVSALSLVLCALRVFSECDVCSPARVFAAAFTSITQGLVVAGAVLFGDYHMTKPK